MFREWVLRTLESRDDEVEARAVHELERVEHVAEARSGVAEHGDARGEIGRGDERDVDARGEARGEERHLGHHAEGALRADEELLEVVSGVILAQDAEEVEDGAVGEHRLDAEDAAVEGSVAEEAEAAGVGGDVAADLTLALGAEVQGDGHAVGVERGLEVLEDHASLGDDGAGAGVDAEHAVHATRAEDHLVVHGDAAAHQAGVAALGDDRQAAVVAVAEDQGYLLGRAREEEHARRALVLAHPIHVRLGEGTRIHANAVRVQRAAEKREVGGRQRRVVPAGGFRTAAHPRRRARREVTTRGTAEGDAVPRADH